ncbi:MSH2 protein [Hypoxylon texense]
MALPSEKAPSTVATEVETPRDPSISDDESQIMWHDRSLPKYQFADLILEEMGRIWDADPRSQGRKDRRLHVNPRIRGGWLYDQAREEVQAQWVEQGIWKDSWQHMELGPPYTDSWKHEIPPPSLYNDDDTATTNPHLPSAARTRPMWRAEQARQREASRPINMFLYQVTNECERLADYVKAEAATAAAAAAETAGDNTNDQDDQAGQVQAHPVLQDPARAAGDINTRAYERVRARWTARRIWDDGWGVLPGMAWRHEGTLPVEGEGEGGEGEGEGEGEESETIAKETGERLMRDKEAREGVLPLPRPAADETGEEGEKGKGKEEEKEKEEKKKEEERRTTVKGRKGKRGPAPDQKTGVSNTRVSKRQRVSGNPLLVAP